MVVKLSRLFTWIKRIFSPSIQKTPSLPTTKLGKTSVLACSKYFTKWELNCNCDCEGLKLDPKFDELLLKLRENVGEPMIVSSCCRCAKHNKNVGGNARSLHVYDKPAHPTNGTCAIDIKRKSKTYDLKMFLEAWELNFSVGIHPSFLHFDARTAVLGMPQTIFSYSGRTDLDELRKYKNMVGLK